MQNMPGLDELFERRQTYPDFDPQERLARLVGLDDQKARLAKILGLLVNPAGLEKWAARFHVAEARPLLDVVMRRPPLVVLAGDVGSGKTELAETIGDPVARQEGIELTLFPLSLATRGQGRVGEMTQLLSAAFEYTVQAATRLKGAGKAKGGIILLVDEADALAQSREAAQMHHEDRAGVNAFIRGIDRLANLRLPAAVIMCTNRLNALDPAIRRRAADVMAFVRPNEEQRAHILSLRLGPLGLGRGDVQAIVEATGQSRTGPGFTFSDLTQRLLPAIVLDAYPDRAVEGGRAVEIARAMKATPAFRDEPVGDAR
ncbi:UNVERIFIED_ORG: AAA+ superfamily predicted ATPase [Xanthobacter viscosus]|uniref:AAA family ATPase n=1 Tax=Xanthobacter autotrophicus TaxID=280 RepID=A0A6C1KCR9_XANAU|nr:AAA family ATPase [Xanthobacter autotrophicus]TLX41347.1 AAA family ATPase [Xanthobacter autotrophicus]